MSYASNKILNDYKRGIEIMDKTIEVREEIMNHYSEQVIILTERIDELTEQVAYWTNLYRELKNAEGETK